MQGVRVKKPWLLAALVTGLIIFAGVRYFDYKTNQLMAQASPGVVRMLEVESASDSERVSGDAAGETRTEAESESLEGVGLPSPSAEAAVRESERTGNVKPASSSSESTADMMSQSPVKAEDRAVAEKAVTPEPAQTEAVSVNPEAASLSEKAKAYKLAASKLSAGEINSLIQWSQGGFTQDEKEKAKALFYSRFTAEEQQWILGLFKKYGQ